MLREEPLVIRALNAGDYAIRQKKQFHYLLDWAAARAPVGYQLMWLGNTGWGISSDVSL